MKRVSYTKLSLVPVKSTRADVPPVKMPVESVVFLNHTIAEQLAQYSPNIAAARESMEPIKRIRESNTATPRQDNPFCLEPGVTKTGSDNDHNKRICVRTVVSAPAPAPAAMLRSIEGRDDNPFVGTVLSPCVKTKRETITRAMQLQFVKKLWLTSEEIMKIQTFSQRSPEWFEARKGRISGSVVSNITGENPFTRPDGLLREKLWGNFRGNEATRYGTWHEPVAEYVHTIACQQRDPLATIAFPGLIVSAEYPWLSYSADGIVTSGSGDSFLAEYKCPFKQTFYSGKKRGDANIPVYYRSQVQFGMMLLNLPNCEFVVWTPRATRIERYAHDAAYCKWMVKKVNDFYFQRYLPSLVAQEMGWLPHGVINASEVCDVETVTMEDALSTKPVSV